MNIFEISRYITLVGWLFCLLKWLIYLKKKDSDKMMVGSMWLLLLSAVLNILNLLNKYIK